jgi:hypothetical protein
MGERLMHMVLLFIGVLSGIAGAVMLAYGAANSSAAIGHTLIISGTTALATGLIVIGLAAVVSRIRRLAEALDRQPLPRIAGERFDVGRFERKDSTELAPVLPPAVSVAQAEQQDGAVEEPPLGPISAPDTHQGVDAAGTSPPTEPSVADTVAAPPASTEPVSSERGAKPSDSWPAAPSVPEAEPVEPGSAITDGPETAPPEAAALGPRPRYQPVVPRPRPAAPPPAAPPELSAPAAAPIILKSGVLDGMAYTLYSDGSIEAELRDGTMRFRSIPELRAYMFEHAR